MASEIVGVLVIFFVWNAYQTVPPCQNFLTGQPAKPGKYYKKFFLTKRPLRHKHRHWGIGITGYTFGSMIQAQEILLPSWGFAPLVTTGNL